MWYSRLSIEYAGLKPICRLAFRVKYHSCIIRDQVLKISVRSTELKIARTVSLLSAEVFYGCWQLCQSIFKSVSLFFKAAIYPKKVQWAFTHKIEGKVGLHSKISELSVQNRNFIAKITAIWSLKVHYHWLKEFFTKNVKCWSIIMCVKGDLLWS